jgi:hypothetical protein
MGGRDMSPVTDKRAELAKIEVELRAWLAKQPTGGPTMMRWIHRGNDDDTAQKLAARVAALREGCGPDGVPPIRYVAELIGIDSDSEKAIRWLIALMVLCCDPLATALTAAASARRSTAFLVRSTFDSCRADANERHSAYGPQAVIHKVARFEHGRYER